MKILIKGGRIIDPLQKLDAVGDVAIAAGRIVAVGAVGDSFHADQTIDAAGLVVAPGLVDLSARLREPGFEYRATLESEMQAAVAGGVTALACPPDTDPVLDEPALVEMLKHRARQLNQAHVFPLGALTRGLEGEVITEMAELAEAGCVGFSQADLTVTNTQVLMRALQYAKTFGLTVHLRPQDAFIGKGGVAHSGAYASRMGLSGVPVMAETIALMTLFELIRSTGTRVHLCRLSSARGLELVRQAKREGLPVTCDVAIHHVHLTDLDIGFFDPKARVTPPFREERDRTAIRAALLDGTIDAICSDHTPVDDDAKLLPFGEAEPGATGLELLLPLTLKWVSETGADLSKAISLLTHRPADILGCPVGDLRPGRSADICVFDPHAEWMVQPETLYSQGKHTPYQGYTLIGQNRVSLVGGVVAFQRGV